MKSKSLGSKKESTFKRWQCNYMLELTTPWLNEWIENGEIDSGGQGVVTRLAHKTESNKTAVLKQIVPRWRGNKQAIDRLKQEIQALINLSCLNGRVPKIYDSFINYDDAQPFVIMEYIEGVRFDDWLKSNAPMSIERAVEMVSLIAETIELCHNNGIGHRDLKPTNIILKNGSEKLPYILDFGVSFDSRQSIALTREGEMFWNEFIMIPECQDLNGGHRDLRSDITALVGILFYCMTGKPPVILRDAEEKSPHQRHANLLHSSVVSKSHGERLNWIFEKGFKFKLADRYQCLEDFNDDIKKLLESDDVNEIDLLKEFQRLNGIIKQKDRGVLLAQLRGRYQKFIEQTIQKIEKIVAPLRRDEWSCSFQSKVFTDLAPKDRPVLEAATPLQGGLLLYTFKQTHFKMGVGVFLLAIELNTEIHLLISSTIAPKGKITKPDEILEWTKLLVFRGDEIDSNKSEIIVEGVRSRLAREIRNLSNLAARADE